MARVPKRAIAAIAAALLTAAAGWALCASAASYAELLAQAKSDAASVDFTALREAYAGSTQYNPYDREISALWSSMLTAYGKNDCAAALQDAGAILAKNYLFIDAHVLFVTCRAQVIEPAQVKQHDAMARGLLRSIMASGDGKSAETAFVVISVAEEYSLLGVTCLRPVRQHLLQKDGHKFDVLEAVDTAGRATSVYFNIDRPAAWFTRQQQRISRIAEPPTPAGSPIRTLCQLP